MLTPPIEFQTDRLCLRLFIESDARAIFKYASDPQVTKYMDWPTHNEPAESEAFIQSTITERAAGTNFTWAVTDRINETVMGAISCCALTHRVSFGYVLAKEYWNKGFATEASSAVVGWLSDQATIHRIWAVCDTQNLSSAKVLEKVGLSKEGTLAKWEQRPNLAGSPVRDVHVFALTRAV